jgi:carboxymethylenebutenolidase
MRSFHSSAFHAAIAFVLAAAACGLARAQAPDPVQTRLNDTPRHHEWVEIETPEGRKVKTFVVFPEVKDKATAVIIIHENKGLTDWERSVADRLAEAGYVALAPDFLSGAGPDGGGTSAFASRDAATQGIYALKPEQVTADLDAVAAYAKKIEAANGKVAVIGFCWGGGKSFAYAGHNPDLAAAMVCYGTAPEDDAALKAIKAPVYGFYGGNDARITSQVPRVAESMKKLGKTYEPVVYEGAGHGFLRAGEQPTASEDDKKAFAAGWDRVKKILASL